MVFGSVLEHQSHSMKVKYLLMGGWSLAFWVLLVLLGIIMPKASLYVHDFHQSFQPVLIGLFIELWNRR